MRNPADDAAGQRRSRWRGRGTRASDAAGGRGSSGRPGGAAEFADAAGSHRDSRSQSGSGRGAHGHRGAATREVSPSGTPPRRGAASDGRPPGDSRQAGGSVFTPGYGSRPVPDPADLGRIDPAGGADAGSRIQPARYGYGVAEGSAGKGPVRGYPPAPGQPPPLYPPGQFAAWNRRHDGAAHAGGPPPNPAERPTGSVGPTAESGGSRLLDSAATAGPSRQASERTAAGGAALSRYYGQDTDPGADPGYPVLAVSDPAADATSTQTWQAVAEGRATGIWAAPPGLRDRRNPAASPALDDNNVRDPDIASGTGTVTAADGRDSAGPRSGPNTSERPGPPSTARSGPDTVPPPERSPETPTRAHGRVAGRTASQERAETSRRTRSSRRRRPVSVPLAMLAALVLVLAAAGTLGLYVLHHTNRPRPVGQSAGRTSPSPSPTATLSQYGLIASRQTDPQPLTVAQLFPASFAYGGMTVTSTATSLGSDCAAAVVGSSLQSAVGSAGCTQVARATYLTSDGIMGTIGVLNLSTAQQSAAAAQVADASDYISQLAGPRRPTKQIGQGTGIEQAAAKGHYLILIWAELTDLAKPSALQTTELETFMTQVLQSTANVSLSTRMLTGSP